MPQSDACAKESLPTNAPAIEDINRGAQLISLDTVEDTAKKK